MLKKERWGQTKKLYTHSIPLYGGAFPACGARDSRAKQRNFVLVKLRNFFDIVKRLFLNVQNNR